MIMSITKPIMVIGLCTLIAGALSAQPVFRKPPEPVRPGLPAPKLDPKQFQTCHVDPAIGNVIVTKVSPRSTTVRITVEVINVGPSAWVSGANQQSVRIEARNGRTRATFRDKQPLAANVEAGGRMIYYTTAKIPDAFDNFEWGGNLLVSIGYDPDITIDGNDCNDDRDLTNNRKEIGFDGISAVMGSDELSQTF
jgi:hypothetical protein